jgi:hypothetical protein
MQLIRIFISWYKPSKIFSYHSLLLVLLFLSFYFSTYLVLKGSNSFASNCTQVVGGASTHLSPLPLAPFAFFLDWQPGELIYPDSNITCSGMQVHQEGGRAVGAPGDSFGNLIPHVLNSSISGLEGHPDLLCAFPWVFPYSFYLGLTVYLTSRSSVF